MLKGSFPFMGSEAPTHDRKSSISSFEPVSSTIHLPTLTNVSDSVSFRFLVFSHSAVGGRPFAYYLPEPGPLAKKKVQIKESVPNYGLPALKVFIFSTQCNDEAVFGVRPGQCSSVTGKH